MSRPRSNQHGFGVVGTLVILVMIGVLVFVGWHVSHTTKAPVKVDNDNAAASPAAPASGAYAGWKSALSPRAKFTIRYPVDWKFQGGIGKSDNVEHITLDSSHFHLTIDSFMGNQGGTDATGATAAATCTDCIKTVSSKKLTLKGLGDVTLDTVTYKIDDGDGNAIILRQPDGTYGILAPKAANVYTNFRGTSVLDSKQAYQSETLEQFASNPDLVTAQRILQSVTYL